MERIIAHKGYWCKVVQQGWKVRTWESKATGQKEVIVYPRNIYVPQGDIDDPSLLVHEVDQSGTLLEEERKSAAALKARERERSRAKTKCRHRIKSHNLAQMLTGTYLENMVDFNRARSDFAAWLRLVRKYIPGFKAVFAFERQKRGAWHWHCAIERLPPYIVLNELITNADGTKTRVKAPTRSYAFVRKMWIRVVGKFDGRDNGTVNVDGHSKGTGAGYTRKAQSLAHVAAYVSKYLTKAHEDAIEGRNMWGSTQGLEGEKPVTIVISENCPLYRIMDMLLVDAVPPGHRIVSHQLGRFKDFWLLYTEPVPD